MGLTGGFQEHCQSLFIGLAARSISVSCCFPFLFFHSMGWYCGAGVFGLIGPCTANLSQPCTANLCLIIIIVIIMLISPLTSQIWQLPPHSILQARWSYRHGDPTGTMILQARWSYRHGDPTTSHYGQYAGVWSRKLEALWQKTNINKLFADELIQSLL